MDENNVPVLLHLGTIFSNLKRCKEDIVKWKEYSSFLNERIDVSSQYSYCLYTDKSTRFTDTRNHLLTEYWNRAAKAVSVNDYVIAENQHDAFMKYSDYCNLRAMLGLPQISLAEGQYIIHCLPYLKDTFYANENLQIKNSTLAYSGICTEAFSQYGGYGNGQDFLDRRASCRERVSSPV